MLNSLFRTPIELVSGGVACARSLAAGASVRASGCSATENGRSWLRITGVVSWNSGREALSAGASACANGTSAWSVGPARVRERAHLAERLARLLQRSREQRQR